MTQDKPWAARLAAYKRDGYTIFERVFNRRLMAAWKAAYPSIVARQYRDNHQGPGVQAIVQAARDNEDRRLMRLFGEDPLLFPRGNYGYTYDDEEIWDQWIAEDRRALKQPTPIGLDEWSQ